MRKHNDIRRNRHGLVVASRSKVTGKLIYWFVDQRTGNYYGKYLDDTTCGDKNALAGLKDRTARRLRLEFEEKYEGKPVRTKRIKEASPEFPDVENVPRETETTNQASEVPRETITYLEEKLADMSNELLNLVEATPVTPESLFALSCLTVTGFDKTAARAIKYAVDIPKYSPMASLILPLIEDYVSGEMKESQLLTLMYDGTILEKRREGSEPFTTDTRYLVRLMETVDDLQVAGLTEAEISESNTPIKGLFDQVIRRKAGLSVVFSIIIPSRDAVTNGMIGVHTPAGEQYIPVATYKELNPDHNLDEPMKEAAVMPVMPFEHLDEAIDFVIRMIPIEWSEQRSKLLKNIGAFIHDVKEVRAITSEEANNANPFAFLEDVASV